MTKPTSPKPAARARKAAAKGEPVKPGATAETPQRAAKDNAELDFPVVGIGASAGGLEAIEQFLKHTPPDTGMAFVVIQHLDPTHKGMLPELLQRATPMEVFQARNGMQVAPNRIYVIPPNKYLTIVNGALYLREPIEPRGLRLPIDFFLRSLAEDRGARSVGIILSGMGSDGTLGVRAIKEKGGLVLAQEPTSAKYDSMPISVVDSGLADIVATAAELPKRLIDTVRLDMHERAAHLAETSVRTSALEKIFALLKDRTTHDFSLYKKSTLYRRIERRMSLHQLGKIDDYVHLLRENQQEIDLLFRELLIGVTNFFRDPPAWASLEEDAFPALFAANPKGRTLRAWVAGCSTGEEAFSLAITFVEALEKVKPQARFTLQIFATDVGADAIAKARQGFYPANIAADVSSQRLGRFFVEEGNGYSVRKDIREMVVFAEQNIAMDPPFTRLDVLICRNVLIYLSGELQKKLMPLFHYCLNPGGVLFLGSAETVGSFTDLFAPMCAKARIYRRSDLPMRAAEVEFPNRMPPTQPAAAEVEAALETINLQDVADRLILDNFAAPAVLINADGNILYISGRTGNYLEPAAGKANWNIHAMAREGLRQELVLVLPKALRENRTVKSRDVRVGLNNESLMADITVYPLSKPEALRGTALVVFHEVAMPAPSLPTPVERSPSRGKAAALERTLDHAKLEIQNLREEMQTQQEELKSSSEELQSTNEELQSTNEELTTSKEELQSINEELQTVNAQLKAKVDELSSTNNDMTNLFNSTDVATIFLDSMLRVRRYTTQTTRIFKLIPSDVGRSLSDVVNNLDYPALQADTQEVLRTLAFVEKEIPTRDGRWYSVKILPYRTLENVIDGVVITLSDITQAKKLEAELRNALARSESVGDRSA